MISPNSHIVFDLDDTLYKEIDFVKSAYLYINQYLKKIYGEDFSQHIENCLKNKINFYDIIDSKLNHNQIFPIEKYLELYRFHPPDINLSDDTVDFINKLLNLNIEFSIITDGRSISQRNKISALGLNSLVKNIIISEETGFEKPHSNNFKILNRIYTDTKLIYIADNTSKDFSAPNNLKWDTICLLDNGRNIHKQNFDLEFNFLPKLKITTFKELIV